MTFPVWTAIRSVARHGFQLRSLAEVVLSGPDDDMVLVDRDGPVSRAELRQAVRESDVHAVVEGHHDRTTIVGLLAAGLAGSDVMVIHPGAEIPVVEGNSGRVWLGTTGTTRTPRHSARARYGPGVARPVLHLWRTWLRGRPGAVMVLPGLDHGYGLGFVLATLLLRRTVILPPRRDPTALDELATRWSPSMAVAVPTQLLWLTELTSWSPSVLVTGSSPLSLEVQQRVEERFGPVLHNLYGSTEAGFSTVATPSDLASVPGCVGRPLPGIRIRIRHGLVESRSPFATHRGRWVPTGDTGHFEEGLLVLDGRADRIAVVDGVNLSLTEIHAALATHPDVDEVTVTARPHEVSGQEVVASVRATVSEPEMQQWLLQTVGPRARVRLRIVSGP